MDELERLLKDRREVVARIVHEVADAVRRDIISRAKRPTEHYKGAEHYADAIIAIISEPALLEVGRLRGALERILTDATDGEEFTTLADDFIVRGFHLRQAREAILSLGERKEGAALADSAGAEPDGSGASDSSRKSEEGCAFSHIYLQPACCSNGEPNWQGEPWVCTCARPEPSLEYQLVGHVPQSED